MSNFDHSKLQLRFQHSTRFPNLCVHNSSTTPSNNKKKWRSQPLPINQGEVTQSQQIRLGYLKHKKIDFFTAIGKPWNFLLQDEDSQRKWANIQGKSINMKPHLALKTSEYQCLSHVAWTFMFRSCFLPLGMDILTKDSLREFSLRKNSKGPNAYKQNKTGRKSNY